MKITNTNIPMINNDQKKVNQNADKKVKVDEKFNQLVNSKIAEDKKTVDNASKTAVKEPVTNVSGNTANATRQAEHMKEVKNFIKSTPEVRSDKVEEIKAKIANGTYNVSSEELADKLINSGVINNLLKTL